MARASIPTLLSLDQYAQVMGINPAHFNGGATATVMSVQNNPCNDIWPQYSWQAFDRVSREDLALEIANAEEDIANYVRYWPAPKFISKEMHTYPRHHRPDVISYGGMYDVRNYGKSLAAKWGKFIQAGQRTVSQQSGAAVAYSSADGDSINETATVTATTSLSDPTDIKVYFAGHGGDEEWEIRPARSKSISSGTFTATFWAWQFIDPDLWEALTTTAGFEAVDWSDSDNLVASVEVYREYADFTKESCQLFWEPLVPNLSPLECTSCCGSSSGCPVCTLTVQDGCIHVRDVDAGIVVPTAGSYDSDSGAWVSQAITVCREPDIVKIWYYAGDIYERYLQTESYNPLSNYWAQIIAYLATARIERPFCSCANVTSLAQYLREDLAFMGREGSYASTEEMLNNPFGTRRGEVMAWKKLGKLAHKRMAVALA